MKRIDCISELKNKCTGCMACVDVCPVNCISSVVGEDGFKYTVVDESMCVSCGKCYSVCPIETQCKHNEEQHLFAAYSKNQKIHNRGSSGGIFELLAEHFISKQYYVCGSVFEGTTVKHRIIDSIEEIQPLLKSKYIQSDMSGNYSNIKELLKKGEKVFYCGTPCQVSALINSIPDSLKDNLFTADFICHGVPSQHVFDEYIKVLEKKHGCKVSDFSFRIKDNKYKHSHGYSYNILKKGKIVTVNGIYTDSSFYNAFKNYLILRDSCYNCQYTTLQRVSDITLADFWGIEKYDFNENIDSGVSMVITNTQRGNETFALIRETTVSKEYPIQYGVDSNFCLTHTTQKPKIRDTIIKEISENGYEQTAKKYFGCRKIYKLYWLIPPKVRNIIRKLRGN